MPPWVCTFTIGVTKVHIGANELPAKSPEYACMSIIADSGAKEYRLFFLTDESRQSRGSECESALVTLCRNLSHSVEWHQ
jgi:hypothetical protein